MKNLKLSLALCLAFLTTPAVARAQADCAQPLSIDAVRDLVSNASEARFRESVQKCGLSFQWTEPMNAYFSRLGLTEDTMNVMKARASTIDLALVEITFWNSIKDDKSPETFQLYVQRYPRGQFIDIAQLRIQQLTKPVAPPTPPPPSPPTDAERAAPYLARIATQLRATDPAAAEQVLAELVAAVPGADVRNARRDIEDLRRRIDDGKTRAAGTAQSSSRDGLTYVWIPAGTFQMGCSVADRECNAAENPAHQVRLSSGYWLGQTEVTADAYQKFLADSAGRPFRPDPAQGKLPHHSASWQEAQQYCQWMGGRLPTEAEWEYAARAGSTGARYGDAKDIAWFKDNSSAKVHEVGTKKSNAWGVQDTLGNLWEWTQDWYAADAYRPAAVSDPTGPASGTQRVVRGGSWDNAPGLLRVSLRFGNEPAARSANNGFRCALKVLP